MSWWLIISGVCSSLKLHSSVITIASTRHIFPYLSVSVISHHHNFIPNLVLLSHFVRLSPSFTYLCTLHYPNHILRVSYYLTNIPSSSAIYPRSLFLLLPLTSLSILLIFHFHLLPLKLGHVSQYLSQPLHLRILVSHSSVHVLLSRTHLNLLPIP